MTANEALKMPVLDAEGLRLLTLAREAAKKHRRRGWNLESSRAAATAVVYEKGHLANLALAESRSADAALGRYVWMLAEAL